MKKLLLILLAIPFLGLAQEADWHPLPSDQVSYFRQYNIHFSHNSYILPMRIDSIKSSFSGFLYFNIRTPIRVEQDEDYLYYNPNTSWIGDFTMFDMGKAWFQYQENQFMIDYVRSDHTPWVFYTYEDDGYIEAHYSTKDYIEILEGLSDSVKYLCFQTFNSDGSLTDGSFDNDTLILSKNYGFVRGYKFTSLPGTRNYANLIGIEIDGEKYGFDWNYDDFIGSYEIGDLIQVQMNNYKKQDQYISKTISDDFIDYTILRCATGSLELDTIYRKFPVNLLPGQTYFGDDMNGMGYSLFIPLTSLFLESNQYQIEDYHDFFETELNGEIVWAREPYISMSDYPMQLCNEYHYYCECSNADGDSYDIVYLKTLEEEWGTPLSFICTTSVTDLSRSKLSISPNPSSGNFSFTNNSSKKIEEIIIYNTNGKIIWQQEAQENKQQIDVSFLSTGLYLMKVYLEDGEVMNRKIMIQK